MFIFPLTLMEPLGGWSVDWRPHIPSVGHYKVGLQYSLQHHSIISASNNNFFNTPNTSQCFFNPFSTDCVTSVVNLKQEDQIERVDLDRREQFSIEILLHAVVVPILCHMQPTISTKWVKMHIFHLHLFVGSERWAR